MNPPYMVSYGNFSKTKTGYSLFNQAAYKVLGVMFQKKRIVMVRKNAIRSISDNNKRNYYLVGVLGLVDNFSFVKSNKIKREVLYGE